MTEKEMEDLLWHHPDKFFDRPIGRFQRQHASAVGRADLVFIRSGHLLIVEVKHGTLPREAATQAIDYRGALRHSYPDASVIAMVVANSIPEERRLACYDLQVECVEIPEQKFREVAMRVGYILRSEATPQNLSGELSMDSLSGSSPRDLTQAIQPQNQPTAFHSRPRSQQSHAPAARSSATEKDVVRPAFSSLYEEIKKCLLSMGSNVNVYPAAQDRIRATVGRKLFAKLYFRQRKLRLSLFGGASMASPRIEPDEKKPWGSIRFDPGEALGPEVRQLVRQAYESALR